MNSRPNQREVPRFSDLFDRPLILMDGGLGTTLEDQLGPEVAQSTLWSAHPVAHNSEAVVQAHLAFLHAGSKIISTSTYQCSFETFSRAGFNAEQAKDLMLQSVRLADRARSIYQTKLSSGEEHAQPIHIALSLGPLGATLKPTQEFCGFYPPPYGPRSFVEGAADNVNSFEPDAGEREHVAVEALETFHFDRLMIFADDSKVWACIDCIAFETIPLRREVTAIRKAVGRLQDKLEREGRRALKPWWISCVFPNGASPEDKFPRGPKVQINEMAQAAFTELKLEDAPISYSVRPSGFGINCTAVRYAQDLGAILADVLKTQRTAITDNGDRPWLILYPNGNDVFDEATQSWKGLQEGKENEWAEEVGAIVTVLTSKDFGGIVVGGCCRTGPQEIAALDRYLFASA